MNKSKTYHQRWQRPSQRNSFPCLLLFCFGIQLAFIEGKIVPKQFQLSALPFLRGGEFEKSHDKKYVILEEKVMYKRWRTLISRVVRCPDGKELDFDVVAQSGSNRAVLIFAWNTKTKTATIIKEYMPGANQMKYGIAAGLVEDKHASEDDEDDPKLIAARHELEEECHLVGGTWIQLVEDTIMDKYSTTVVNVYLVLDPEKAVNPKPLDEEEDIEIVPHVSIPEIQSMIAAGEMNVVGGWACLVAIEKLREMNLAS